MIEIVSTNPKKEEKTKIKSRKKTITSSTEKNSFKVSLENTITVNVNGTIEELMTDLDEQGKQFLDKQNLVELSKYKAVVQKILKLIMSEGFKTQTIKRSRTDRSDFLVISKINEKLLEITEQITRGSAFNLLKSIEEIRGLVFDLVF
jgi:uncharacterized protein YaaR (DUF327 family)